VPEIVSLARYHDRSRFDCGVPELNSFIKATARQHGDKGISRTFVLSDQEKPATILGYFTLTLCEVRSIFPRHMQRNIHNMDFLPFALRDLLFPENTRERAMAACCSRKQSTGRS
jgi:hypothetical protein